MTSTGQATETTDQADRPLVDNDTVWAFLDGDGADPEAFENLRRRITLVVPFILDSEVGRDYAVGKLADAARRGAVKALRGRADLMLRGNPLSRKLEAEDMRALADAIESGEVPL